MKIAIDARWIFSEASGIGVYTQELITGLAKLDSENDYLLLFDSAKLCERATTAANLNQADNFSSLMLSYGVFSIQGQVLLPGALRRRGINVFHSPNYMIPLLAFPRSRPGPIRCVVTIHDVIPLIFPHHAPRSRKSRFFPLYRWLMQQISVRSDIMIADSEASRADVITHLRIAPQRQDAVHAVYCGVSDRFRPCAESAPDCAIHERSAVKSSDEHEPRIVLYVGRADPYKNCVGLVEAFAIARRNCPFPLKLAIAGPRDERYPAALERAAELGVTGEVSWVYLSADELVHTYRTANVMVLPSLYEGFGLTAVEAMACGTPVICSNRGALPEVTGDAAIHVDPFDNKELAARITKVLTDPNLAHAMSKKGLKQAKKFKWRRTAEQTLGLYREAMNLRA